MGPTLQDTESCQLLTADFPFAFIGMGYVRHACTQSGASFASVRTRIRHAIAIIIMLILQNPLCRGVLRSFYSKCSCSIFLSKQFYFLRENSLAPQPTVFFLILLYNSKTGCQLKLESQIYSAFRSQLKGRGDIIILS